MTEAAWWKARLLRRVESARDRVRDADGDAGLRRVRDHFHSPVSQMAAEMAVPWTAAFRIKLDLMMDPLREVTQNLSSAVVYMEAAEILAVPGGNVNPSAVQAALGRVRTSRARAVEACRSVQWCRGCLLMAIARVNNPGIQNAIVPAGFEYSSAYAALTDAIQRTQAALGELIIARQILTP